MKVFLLMLAVLVLVSCNSNSESSTTQENGQTTGWDFNHDNLAQEQKHRKDDETLTRSQDVESDQSPEDEQTLEETDDQATNNQPNQEETRASRQKDRPSNRTPMALDNTLSGLPITPKSIMANGHGLLIANNMMYSHNIAIFDANTQENLQILSDTVNASDFDMVDLEGEITGAPVEAVWTKDGQYAYVSQYSLANIGAPADDLVTNGTNIAPSVVYRYSVTDQNWDQVIRVGRIPKYLALTPDESKLLVSNWGDSDLSIIDTQTAQEIDRIPLNSAPRGIVVLSDNQTAFVTAMFAHEVYEVNIETGESQLAFSMGEGSRPRHLILDNNEEKMYLTLSGTNELVRFDVETRTEERRSTIGPEPRTMEISADGTALYVVNYHDNSMSKIDIESMTEIQRLPTSIKPIGVSFEPTTNTVWVANYDGNISIFLDDSGEDLLQVKE